jgi:hypothetical protein
MLCDAVLAAVDGVGWKGGKREMVTTTAATALTPSDITIYTYTHIHRTMSTSKERERSLSLSAIQSRPKTAENVFLFYAVGRRRHGQDAWRTGQADTTWYWHLIHQCTPEHARSLTELDRCVAADGSAANDVRAAPS